MGDLTLIRKLADGSAVEAWLGHHQGAHYLVQLSRPQLNDHRELYWHFLDASRTSSSVAHPELLSPRKFGQGSDGRTWVVSDAITGWTASDVLHRRGSVQESLALDWGLAVCEALEVMHASGRVHGCLAPRHLHLLGEPEAAQVRLMDTSLLHFRGQKSLSPPTGSVVVEPEYLSPERASGSRCTAASDIWGLGVLLVELLTGYQPYRGLTAADSRKLVLSGRPVQLPSRLERWQELINACLSHLPTHRLGSALEVRQALVGLL